MRETDDGTAARRAEGIESGGFHLDGERAQIACPRDRRLGFAIRRVCRPRRAPVQCNSLQSPSGLLDMREKRRVRCFGEGRAR